MTGSIPPRVTTSIGGRLRAVESILLALESAHRLHKEANIPLSDVRRHLALALYELAPGVHEAYRAGNPIKALIAMVHPERSTTPPPTTRVKR